MATGTKTRSNARSAQTEGLPNEKFQALFMAELKDIYWAEKHLYKFLQKIQKYISTHQLLMTVADHEAETAIHIERLEEVFALMDKKPSGQKCEAMAGLIHEAQDFIDDTDAMVRDAALIISLQKMEHYEIASYGSLRTLAAMMNKPRASDILGTTLLEEKDADSMLTNIAETSVNEEAVME
ncbi:rubrerythrin family protein [Chitinophaga caeni]|uniref:Rubrerythrin family protein n=1 Tax=Chitinophaga caeni TaxID=2029983 RepID=A0A291QRA0_9BACT|nr:DUF892 family protein [Chitinophaga caeni]ATL46467.1 rubrerythrin family protein [Chitinophaga caeni]